MLVLRLLGITLGLSYPFLVYFGIQYANASLFGIVLIVGLALRARVMHQKSPNQTNLWQTASIVILISYSVLISLFNSELWLRFYPVAANLCVAMLFLTSLKTQPLIEKIARTMGQEIPNEAKPYLYWLTFSWGLLLIANAAAASYTACCMTMKQWAVYNGLLSYFIMAAFFCGEYVFRYYYKRKHERRLAHPQNTRVEDVT